MYVAEGEVVYHHLRAIIRSPYKRIIPYDNEILPIELVNNTQNNPLSTRIDLSF